MPSPLRQPHQVENHDLEQKAPRYHDFNEISNQSAKLQELIFFASIGFFSLVTVFFAFVLLALNLVPFLAFIFSGLMSFGVTKVVSNYLKTVIK